jgi:diamine N-acetyltransferase
VDETAAGFMMLWDEHLGEAPVQIGRYYLWRFMIDAQFQGKGIGREALRLLVQHVRTRPHAQQLLLSHSKGDGNPGPFYRKLGFTYTGNTIDGELEMSLDLNDRTLDNESSRQAG